MRRLLLGLSFIPALPAWSALNVPLTIQEAVYSGSVAGVNRADEPFCQGIPIGDSDAITNASTLGLTGASAGQFRVLGRWPSGNAKWVKVCGIVPSLSAGATATVTLTSGSGNFGGSNLATDNGATISVSTGTAVFTIKKARFNVIDSAVVDGNTIVSPSVAQTRGLVITGPDPRAPYPGNVTCGACTTLYSSANDASSTAVIEENGPVMTVIKATGNHMTVAGDPYMQYTARLYFYKGKSSVKTVVSLRNANYDTSVTPSRDAAGNTFNTAYKGFQAYELRISPNLSGPLTYNIEANGTQTGTLDSAAGTDSVYIYQGASNWMLPMQDSYICGAGSDCGNTYTTDQGFIAKKNTTTLASGSQTQYPQGWAAVSSSSAGLLIGMYQFAAQWPASLEMNGGGTDIRIGLISGKNSKATYQPWPASSTKEAYLVFHTARPSSYANEFLKLQHSLLARAPRAHYNAAGVFPYPIVDPAQEDAFHASLPARANPPLSLSNFCWGGASSNCTPDRNAADPVVIAQGMPIGIYRAYAWQLGGPMNQEEFRWSDMMRFLQRGQTGRWVNSSQFYRFFAADKGMGPHADGTSSTDSTPNNFRWRDRPRAHTSNREVNSRGFPYVACGGVDNNLNPCPLITNSEKSLVSWSFSDYLHNHYSGIFDYYFLTGDEAIRDAIAPLKDFYLNNNTYQGLTDPAASTGWPTRAVGIHMIGAANYSSYLSTIGDSDANGVLDQAKGVFGKHVKTDTCVSGFPSGCTAPPVNSYPSIPDNEPAGVNRKRGVHTANTFRGATFCTDAAHPYGIPAYYRALSTFQASILIEGIMALRRAAGPGWADHKLALDLAYGVGQWGLSEGFSDNGQDQWYIGGGTQASDSLYNGFRFGVSLDRPLQCTDPTNTVVPGITSKIGGVIYNNTTLADNVQGHWMHFYSQLMMNGQLSAADQRKLRMGLYWVAMRKSNWPADYGGYQLGTLIHALNTPPAETLQDVAFTITNQGGGNYRLSWTVPAGARSYRIKWSALKIAPSSGLLNFDVLTRTFGLDPNQYDTWFGANNVNEPAPGAAGTTQTLDITGTGSAALTASNFSVKTYISGAAPPVSSAPASLLAVSGTGQTGSAGQPLPSPFVVKVTNAAGSGIANVPVIFAVTGGGGALSAATVLTNADGLASTVLTLGAGANTVTAVSGTLLGSPVIFTATASSVSTAPSNLVIVSGNNQTGVAGQPLASPFVVRIADSSGNPVANQTVTFTVVSGGGTLSAIAPLTNSLGLASATLTLGPSAGTAAVTATAAGITGSPAVFNVTITGEPATGDTVINWKLQSSTPGWPSYMGWSVPQYDPFSQQTIFYVGPLQGAHGIYATDVYAYRSATNTFTHITGTGRRDDLCPADAPDKPGDRHPGWQMAVDTKRNRMWMYGGVNGACNGSGVTAEGTALTWARGPLFDVSWAGKQVFLLGRSYTVAAVVSPTRLTLTASAGTITTVAQLTLAAPDTNPRMDMYYLELNANPSENRWRQVSTANLPATNLGTASMVYEPEADVLFVYGYDGAGSTRNNWIYCRTAENASPGTPTAKQLAAGCLRPDDWNLITPSGSLPPPYFPGMVYDPATKKIILYGGGLPNGSTFYNQIWAYDVPSRTWRQKALSTTPPPVYSGNYTALPAMAYNSRTQKIHFRQTSNSGAPADWEYDPVADTWKKLTSTGGGNKNDQVIVYDAANNRLVAWAINFDNGLAEVWHGDITGGGGGAGTPPANACDLNSDGAVNDLDAKVSTNQTLGTAACGNGDLNRDGTCNVVDTQLVINAIASGSCPTR